ACEIPSGIGLAAITRRAAIRAAYSLEVLARIGMILLLVRTLYARPREFHCFRRAPRDTTAPESNSGYEHEKDPSRHVRPLDAGARAGGLRPAGREPAAHDHPVLGRRLCTGPRSGGVDFRSRRVPHRAPALERHAPPSGARARAVGQGSGQSLLHGMVRRRPGKARRARRPATRAGLVPEPPVAALGAPDGGGRTRGTAAEQAGR